MLRAIDSHVHLYPFEVNRDPDGWAAANGESYWAALCTRRRGDGRAVQSFLDVSDLLAAMDEAAIGRAVLLGWYWEMPSSCLAQNRFYARCMHEHPDRLMAFATLHPAMGRRNIGEEVRRTSDEGFVGLGELSPHAQAYRTDDPNFEYALELAAGLGWPVNLHVSDPRGRSYPGRVETPLQDFLKLAGKFPDNRFILAHWGGLLPLRLPGAKVPANIYYDTAASPLEHGKDIWGRMIEAVGRDRVIFGSDFPLNLYPRLDAAPNLERFAAEAREALDAEALRAVMEENIRQLV
jgi:predicted TIM-barrel fold metal-dependent hydrolase